MPLPVDFLSSGSNVMTCVLSEAARIISLTNVGAQLVQHPNFVGLVGHG